MNTLSFFLILLSWNAFAGIKINEHCDMPGQDIENLPTSSSTECSALCEKNEKCAGIVFVSGWNRCFLKGGFGKTHDISIYAGTINMSTGKRRPGIIKHYHDNSGKDLRKEPGIKTAEACARICLGEKKCKAFSYVSGYQDCWLKETNGETKPKSFYCGKKSK